MSSSSSPRDQTSRFGSPHARPPHSPQRRHFDRSQPSNSTGTGQPAWIGSSATSTPFCSSRRLVAPPKQPQRRWLTLRIAAGVRHLVFLSTLGADFEPGFTFGRWALAGEQAVARSSIPYTVLRPNSYMSNFYGMLRPADDGALRLPWGHGTSSFVDPRDVAECAARILLEPTDHVAATYSLTGPRSLDAPTVASTLGTANGRPVHYVDTPIEAVSQALTNAGVPAPVRKALVELHAVMANSARSQTTDDVENLTGHAPRSLAQFVADRATQVGELQRTETNELLAVQLTAHPLAESDS